MTKSQAEILDNRKNNKCAICGIAEIDGAYRQTHILIDGFWCLTIQNPDDIEELQFVLKNQGHPFIDKSTGPPYKW